MTVVYFCCSVDVTIGISVDGVIGLSVDGVVDSSVDVVIVCSVDEVVTIDVNGEDVPDVTFIVVEDTSTLALPSVVVVVVVVVDGAVAGIGEILGSSPVTPGVIVVELNVVGVDVGSVVVSTSSQPP